MTGGVYEVTLRGEDLDGDGVADQIVIVKFNKGPGEDYPILPDETVVLYRQTPAAGDDSDSQE